MPGAPSTPRVVRFGEYEADLPAGHLRKRGVKVSLRDQSFDVLAMLLERAGEVVTREELRRRLWPEDVFVDFDNNLNTAIGRLREALGDSAERPRLIETLPRRGYRFIASLSGPALLPPAAPDRRARLVVLPFVNLSGDPAQEYFSDAITEETITALAALAPTHLAVIARTTAMHYKGSRKDVARIGRELVVDYVVEGSARRTEDRVAICVQLIQVSDQAHLWAKKYDAELRDIPSTPGNIAQAIADRLRVQTGAGGRAHKKPTDDLPAYNLYLQGRSHLGKYVPESIAKARQCFEQAIARDPQFALAYDSLAELYWFLGLFGFLPPTVSLSTGIFYALRAIEIDNTLAETHALLGMYRKELDYNWPEVHREINRAMELNPASPVVRFRYAISGPMPQGRIQEAVAEIEAAVESDPLNVDMRCWLTMILYFGRQYDRAMEQGRLALELDPTYFFGHAMIGLVHCEQGAFDEAIAALRRAAELSGNSPLVLGWLGLALARSGNAAEARALIERLHAIAHQAYVPPMSVASIHLGLGEIDSAFEWFDRAVDGRDPVIMPIKSVAFLDPIRDDPRYFALLRKMNLEP